MRLLLLVTTVLLALAAAEGLSRLYLKKTIAASAFTESDLYYYYSPDKVRHHIPNKIGYERMWNDQGKAEFRINSLGLRGPEPAMPKPAGVFRILMLGDSITLGGRLPEEDTFVARIARTFKRENPRYEVVNAGVGDVGLNEEVELLSRVGPVLKPDLIVLCWFLNDGRPPVGFPEETIYRHPAVRWFHRQNRLQRSYFVGLLYEALRQRLLHRQMYILEGETRRFQWVEPYRSSRWASNPAAFEELVHLARFDWGDAWNPESLRRMGERILRIHEQVSRIGAGFAVVALPLHAQVYAGDSSSFVARPQAELGALLRSNGIQFFDPLPLLRSRRQEPLFYDHCHYTPHGNAVMASAILDFLNKNPSLLGR